MIVSVSRRTDIPAYFFDEFLQSLKIGYRDIANPYNPKSIKRVSLLPDDVDAFVFWSKAPAALLSASDILNDYAYYIQYTLNGYGKGIEPGVPNVERGIDTFLRLADTLGAERVCWRYDPMLLSEYWTVERHSENFLHIAEALRGCAQTVTISFVDNYRSSFSRMKKAGLYAPSEEQIFKLAKAISDIGKGMGIQVNTCAEELDFSRFSIGKSSCIDAELISRLTGTPIENFPRDKNQRPLCHCAASADIGRYDTCPACCVYCYATR